MTAMRTLNTASVVLSAVSILVWAGMTWLGAHLIRGVVAQHVTGYPDPVQITYYIRVPAIMLGCAIVAGLAALCTTYTRTARTVQVLLLIALFPFLLPYTGGV
jgi:hypothetical protein